MRNIPLRWPSARTSTRCTRNYQTLTQRQPRPRPWPPKHRESTTLRFPLRQPSAAACTSSRTSSESTSPRWRAEKLMKNSVSWFSSLRPPNPKQDDSTKLFSTRRWRATVVEFRVLWIFVDSHCFLWTRRGRATVVEFRVLRTRVTSGAHRGRELL